MAKVILVTGSNGLIGSEVPAYFAERWGVQGADNNMRASFFGPAGDTRRTSSGHLGAALDPSP